MATPSNKKDLKEKVIRLDQRDYRNSPFVKQKEERARAFLAKHPLPTIEKKEGDK